MGGQDKLAYGAPGYGYQQQPPPPFQQPAYPPPPPPAGYAQPPRNTHAQAHLCEWRSSSSSCRLAFMVQPAWVPRGAVSPAAPHLTRLGCHAAWPLQTMQATSSPSGTPRRPWGAGARLPRTTTWPRPSSLRRRKSATASCARCAAGCRPCAAGLPPAPPAGHSPRPRPPPPAIPAAAHLDHTLPLHMQHPPSPPTTLRRCSPPQVFGIVALQLLVTVGFSLMCLYVTPLREYIVQNQWTFWSAWILAFVMILVRGPPPAPPAARRRWLRWWLAAHTPSPPSAVAAWWCRCWHACPACADRTL